MSVVMMHDNPTYVPLGSQQAISDCRSSAGSSRSKTLETTRRGTRVLVRFTAVIGFERTFVSSCLWNVRYGLVRLPLTNSLPTKSGRSSSKFDSLSAVYKVHLYDQQLEVSPALGIICL